MRRLLAVIVLIVVCGIYWFQRRQPAAPAPAVTQSGAPAATPAAARASLGSFDPSTRIAVVHAKDFAFDAPDTITAGWTAFHLINDGPNLHHLQLVRLDSGKTAADLSAAFKNPGPPPRWAVFVGGPNAPNPGAESDGTVDLLPGNYAFICLVDIPGGVPHVAKGMIHGFTVTPSSANAGAEPTADQTVTLADYTFGMKGSLKAGQHTIKVVNGGPQPHELEMVQLAPGKTTQDLMAWMQKMDGPPPGNAVGGVALILPGMSGYFSANLAAGKYVFVCFVPDAKDGKPHLAHGMVKELTVN